jgi:lipid II:glycine glycyltransferase (peptidoglycan interpeptide bridge formation enzyme)
MASRREIYAGFGSWKPAFMSSAVLNPTMNVLDTSDDGYAVQSATLDKDEWHDILRRFDDATLMQTWSYGAARWGRDNLRHVLLRENGEIVAAAQVVIRRVPLLDAGMSYVKAGPVWKLGGTQRLEILRRMLRALRDICEVRWNLLLRVFSADTEDGNGVIRSIFAEEGFERDLSFGTQRTAFINLSYSLEQLRNSLRPTWRRNLVLAERNGLAIKHGTSDEMFAVFAKLYTEMLDRKQVSGVVSVAHFQEMQKTLPATFKIRVMICEHQGEPIAGLAVPYLGNTAQNMLAATGYKGLHLRGSYLLHWKMLEWLKTQGCRWYDLDGINHSAYPGICQFKFGFAGKLGWEAEYVGRFESCSNPASRFSVKVGERLLGTYRLIESALRQSRPAAAEFSQ